MTSQVELHALVAVDVLVHFLILYKSSSWVHCFLIIPFLFSFFLCLFLTIVVVFFLLNFFCYK
jgi:hypothetical protein